MSDIDTAVVDSLKTLDPNRPIRERREADISLISIWRQLCSFSNTCPGSACYDFASHRRHMRRRELSLRSSVHAGDRISPKRDRVPARPEERGLHRGPTVAV